MFKSVAGTAGIAVFFFVAGCASSPPAESFGRGGEAGRVSIPSSEMVENGDLMNEAQEDSLRDVSYEELFFDLHTEILQTLNRRLEDSPEKIVLIEAQSMVSIAEEMYLEGNVPLAVHLLREAAILLRQTP